MAAESIERLRRLPLAVALVTTLGISAAPTPALATNWPVGRCSDMAGKGGDTLRIAVGKAGNGDTVDLTTLPSTCTGFTLTGGAILVGVTNLSIAADRNITIDGGNSDRVFNHVGSGIFYLRYLTLTHGSEASGDGGCVITDGKLTLSHTTITSCQASANGGGAHAQSCLSVYSAINANLAADGAGLDCAGDAQFVHSEVSGNLVGGGVRAASVESYYSTFANNTRSDGSGGAMYASATVKLVSSTVNGNSAAGAQPYGEGGGVFSTGNVTAQDSIISANTASRIGGGIESFNNIYLTDSTVTGNHALLGGGVSGHFVDLLRTTVDANTADDAAGGVNSTFASINDSTISGNQALSAAGLYGGSITAKNSTVAFNRATGATTGSAGGLRGKDIDMSSTIVAKNSTAGAGAADVYIASDVATFLPTNSLIMSCNRAALSISADPRLTPLALHGGSVRTHALSLTSPAIDAGSPGDQTTDERGSGYPRVVGNAADIGAYERQASDDEFFYSGFE